MTEEIFATKKKELIDFVDEVLNSTMTLQDRELLMEVLDIINEYTFENRLRKKGMLTHILIDSLKIDEPTTVRCIRFDQSIT